MENKEIIESAKDQLNRLLTFFSRVDSQSSVLLTVNIGMLGFLAANSIPIGSFNVYIAFFVALPVSLIAGSLWNLYQGAFPRLDGGERSLVYFRAIAKRTEGEFLEEFRLQNEEQYSRDLLSQIWRNSEILKAKYDHLRRAFILLALAILPWSFALAIFVANQTLTK